MAMKKRSVKKIVIGSIAGLAVVGVVGGTIVSRLAAGSQLPTVAVVEASSQDLQVTVSATGRTESRHQKTYFSPVNAEVSEMNLRVGDIVKDGQAAVKYNLKDLEINNQKAQLAVQQGVLGQQDAVEKAAEANAKVSEAAGKIPSLQAQVDAKQEEVNNLMRQQDSESTLVVPTPDASKIEEAGRKAADAKTAMDAAQAELDAEKEKNEELKRDFELKMRNQIDEATRDDAKAAKEAYNESTKKVNELQADFDEKKAASEAADKELEAVSSPDTSSLSAPKPNIETTIALQQVQADLASLQSELASAKAAAESGGVSMTAAGAAQFNVENNLKELEAKTAAELVEEGKKGIVPDLRGIVSDIKVRQGASVVQGQELFTVSGLDDICVTVKITKNDLEKVKEGQKADVTVAGKKYTGTVDHISRVAVTDEKGTASLTAQIKLDKADEDVFLGVDAKVEIKGDQAHQVVAVPSEAVNLSNEGKFVYVLRDNVIEQRQVETGLVTATMVQISKGLEKGEAVITDIGQLKEGDSAMAGPEEPSASKVTIASTSGAVSASEAGDDKAAEKEK